MNVRRITELFGSAAASVLAAGAVANVAQAQQNTGGTVDLGGSIADSVSGAVSSIATNSGGTVTGSTSVQHNEISLGEQEGLAVSDASGGNNNVSFAS
jgi:hypothetical protein